MTRKWIKVNHLSGGLYSVNKNIRFNTPIIRSYLCDYRDPYIVVKEIIHLRVAGNNKKVKRNFI